MTLIDNIRKRYTINARCKNCGEFQEVSIPKGVSVEQYFKSSVGKCNNCGVAALERFDTKDKVVKATKDLIGNFDLWSNKPSPKMTTPELIKRKKRRR